MDDPEDLENMKAICARDEIPKEGTIPHRRALMLPRNYERPSLKKLRIIEPHLLSFIEQHKKLIQHAKSAFIAPVLCNKQLAILVSLNSDFVYQVAAPTEFNSFQIIYASCKIRSPRDKCFKETDLEVVFIDSRLDRLFCPQLILGCEVGPDYIKQGSLGGFVQVERSFEAPDPDDSANEILESETDSLMYGFTCYHVIGQNSEEFYQPARPTIIYGGRKD